MMMGYRFVVFALSLVCTVLCGASSSVAGDVPERSRCGQTLRVPTEQQTLGEVYYVTPGVGTQLTWEEDAPLLRLVATCNRVVGYFVAPFEIEEGRPPLLGGALRVPVASFSTGYEQFDASFQGPDSLNREEYPEILMSLVSAGPAKGVVKENNREQCEFKLVGELTIKNKKVHFESLARLALLPFSRATEPFSPSDLLMLRTKFRVSLAEVGIAAPSPFGTGFTGKHVDLELYLMCSTIHPSKQFDPRVKDELYVKQLAFMTRLRDFGDSVHAYVDGRALMKEMWDDSRMLNDLAWTILTDEFVKRRDFRFVEEGSQRANELTEYKDPQYLHVLARLCYERGDLDGALKWSRQAVENLTGQPFFVGPPIRAALQEYEAEAQLRRQSTPAPKED